MALELLIIEDYIWLSPLAWYGENSIYLGGNGNINWINRGKFQNLTFI